MFSNRHHASDFHRRQINDLSIAFYHVDFFKFNCFVKTYAVSLGIFLIPIKTISFLSPLSKQKQLYRAYFPLSMKFLGHLFHF